MLENFKKYGMILLGSAISGLALDLFLVPAQIAPGGMSGLATVVHYFTNISVGKLILFLNIPVFILGWIFFGKRLVLTSLVGMFALSFFTEIFAFFPAMTEDVMLCSAFGGVLFGLGLGTVLQVGTTTGGTDILAKILKKFFPAVSLGKFILLIDTIIILFAGIAFRKAEIVLYSAVSLIISSYIIDMRVEGINYSKMVFVISDKSELIAQAIFQNAFRGVTALRGFSMYNRSEKNVLLCVMKRYEIGKLKQLVKRIDAAAFVVVANVREVAGNGFSEL